MKEAKTSGNMLPGLRRVAESARRNPHERQFALAYLIDVDALRRAYHRLRKGAAVGVDGVSKEEYGENLEENLQHLHVRLKAMKYRQQPILRVHIPKDKNRTRPIRISATEDKIVQGALQEILEAIYEQDFLDCSHGFRPRRKAHLVDFRQPPRSQTSGKGTGTFDFLGFTVYWRRNNRGGGWHLSWKTRKARLRRAIKDAYDLCRRQRHRSVPEQHLALKRRIQGHFNYFGINDNCRSLSILVDQVRRAWYKWLTRRSQRSRLNWERFEDLHRDFPLPTPRRCVNLWVSP